MIHFYAKLEKKIFKQDSLKIFQHLIIYMISNKTQIFNVSLRKYLFYKIKSLRSKRKYGRA